MPETRGKPWSTEYMETYRRKNVSNPQIYKRGSNHNRIRVKKNVYTRPRTTDSIDVSERRYNGTHVMFAADSDEEVGDTPLDIAAEGTEISITKSNNNNQHYMDNVKDSFAVDKVRQYSEAMEESTSKPENLKYHWIVWPQSVEKKTETPVVARTESALQTKNIQHKPGCRSETPFNNISYNVKQQDYHWSVWPQTSEETNEPPLRPHTALGIHSEGISNQDIDNFPTYVPELQTWVTASNDYEKDIATKMSGMYLTQSPRGLPDYMRPKREGTFTYGYGNRILPARATPGHYAQSYFPYTHNSLPEELVMQGMTKPLQNTDPIPGSLYRSNTDLARPLNRRVINYPRSEEYVHQHSLFWSTQPLVRGHFIIHPDWVSERLTKRKVSTVYGRKKSGLRYGTH